MIRETTLRSLHKLLAKWISHDILSRKKLLTMWYGRRCKDLSHHGKEKVR